MGLLLDQAKREADRTASGVSEDDEDEAGSAVHPDFDSSYRPLRRCTERSQICNALSVGQRRSSEMDDGEEKLPPWTPDCFVFKDLPLGGRRLWPFRAIHLLRNILDDYTSCGWL